VTFPGPRSAGLDGTGPKGEEERMGEDLASLTQNDSTFVLFRQVEILVRETGRDYWQRERRFAVMKIGRPAPSLFEEIFEPRTT